MRNILKRVKRTPRKSKVSTDNINAGKEADGSERIKEDEEVQIYKPNFNHAATAGGEEGVPDLDEEGTTPTDQTTTTSQDFVTKFLDAAKEVTTYVKENGFTYGHAEHMPPDSNGMKLMVMILAMIDF